MKLALWASAALILLGCQKHPQEQVLTWSEGAGPTPEVFQSPQFQTVDRSVNVLGQTVHFSKQRWGPALVEGGSKQTLTTADGRLLYGQVRFLHSPLKDPSLSAKRLALLSLRKDSFVEQLKRHRPWMTHARLLSEPELVILTEHSPPTAVYSLDLLREGKHFVERLWITPDFELKKRRIVSLDFDSQAWVYTLENRAALQQVLLLGLLDSTILESQVLKVTSQAPVKLAPLREDLNFPVEDPRFDQIQAFYFVQKGLQYFTEQLGFTIPMAVDVETEMGYPQNTNAAFTYHNQIRLGHGDQVVYGPLARDPSIVIHELSHVLIDVVAHLPTQDEGGSMNEGFADFFAASFLNSPRMAEGTYLQGPYKRDLEDKILFNDKNGGLYHDSQIVSGTLWAIRQKWGAELTQKLALKTLAYLGPAEHLTEFPTALLKASGDLLTAEQQQSVSDLMKERQWPAGS